MSFEESIKNLNRVIPFNVPQDFLEEIILNSSFIHFRGQGEVVFKEGDPALGFYWLLKGCTMLRGKDGRLLSEFHSGSMVGLDNFLNREAHRFDIVTLNREVKTLFIDMRCYNYMMKDKHFRSLLNKQLLWQLKSLKSAI